MAKKKPSLLWRLGALLVLCAIAWMKYQEADHDGKPRKTPSKNHQALPNKESASFECLDDCTWVDHRHNDGDSFHVQTPKGDIEFRLYYVDTPESAAKTYGHGENNYKRLSQQGRAMGGLTQQQTTEIGQQAKAFTRRLLSKQKFRIATRWESVYGSERMYAFVILQEDRNQRYLHELLLSQGLARIHTTPKTLPDGTTVSAQKRRLHQLEQEAKKQRLGAWGIQ